MNGIDAKIGGLLEAVLDTSSRREALIASNVANVDTPGYQTRDLDFESAMEQIDRRHDAPSIGLARTDPSHLAPPQDVVRFAGFEFEPTDLARRNDLNNVSVDREMLALAKSAGRYSTAIELLRRRFALLRYAIMDGRSG